MADGGNIITSPAPLVGYEPQMEQPLMPKDQDLGSKFVNAFAKGAEISQRRQALENQLKEYAVQNRRLDLQDKWQNQDLAFKYSAEDLLDKYRQAELAQGKQRIDNANRSLDSLDQYRSDDINLRSLKQQSDIENKMYETTGSADLINSITQNPYEMGSDEARLHLNQIKRTYAPLVGTSDDARRIVEDEERRQDSARTAIRQTQKDEMDDFMKLSPLDPDDLSQPDDAFGDTKLKDGTPARYRVWINKGQTPDKKAAWNTQYITPEEEQDLITKARDQHDPVAMAKLANRDWKTVPTSKFNFYRNTWNEMQGRLQKTPRMGASSAQTGIAPSRDQAEPGQKYRAPDGSVRTKQY